MRAVSTWPLLQSRWTLETVALGRRATIWLLPWAMTTWTTTLQEGNAKNMVLTRSSRRVLKIRQTPLIFLCRVCEFVCRLRQLLR